MVKGINRQVIVVRSPDPSLFEQAIFLLRPDAPESCNVTQDELLRQAQAAAKGYSTAHIPGARLRSRLLGRLFWALAGGGAVGLVWLATSFFSKRRGQDISCPRFSVKETQGRSYLSISYERRMVARIHCSKGLALRYSWSLVASRTSK